ncbi:MAG: CCA tRNA nucleotidyltransferase [Hyphomicrobiaceae bacterium]|nr:CCA tRNA nucleotidyltransferase [Hyphomicrobiaceae bacterium]
MPRHSHDSTWPTLNGAAWLSEPALQDVFDAFKQAGYTLRVVGGAVRNTLLRLPVTDIDLATDARPDTVMKIAAAKSIAVIPTGLTHGTVTLRSGNRTFEVTTLRHDVATDGRHATVAFTDDWKGDAARRDFTMNALYCDSDGALFDPVGGLADLAARRVRFIGTAADRIREDYLRILRFYRFTAQYGAGQLDAEGRDACRALRAGLAGLSGERVREELLRLVIAPYAADVLRDMASDEVLADVLGGDPHAEALAAMPVATPDAMPEHDCDPGDTESATGTVPAADPILCLAVLAMRNTADVDRLRTRMKLSNAVADRCRRLVAAHHTLQSAGGVLALDARGLRRWIYRCGTRAARDALVVAAADSSAASADFGVDGDGSQDTTGAAISAALRIAATWTPPALPVSGADLVARGVAPGPAVGTLLARIEQWWLDHDFPDDRQLITTELDRQLAAACGPSRGRTD